MGAGLGRQEGFFQQLGELGAQSFLFFLLPTVLSAVIVYFLTRCFLRKSREKRAFQKEKIAKSSARDPMMLLALHLQNKMIFMKIQKSVLFHFSDFKRQAAALYCKIIRKLLS